MTFLKKHSFKIAVLALCAVMAIYLFVTKVMEPNEPLPVEQAAPSFEMTNVANGELVSLDSTSGKARIVYFYFANCPDVCPPTTFLLSQVQEQLKEEGTLGTKAELISITFDPERDTPEAILAFAERTFADFEGWSFLRGEPEETIQLAKDFKIDVLKLEDGSFIHANLIVIVDQEGQVRKYISGNDEELTAEQIVKELNKLL